MSAVLEPVAWSPRRWWMTVAMVFVAQIAAVSWLSDRSVSWSAPSSGRMSIHFLEYEDAALLPELFSASDPTMFVMAHPDGFSGGAWLNVPRQDYELPHWNEPLRWLPLPEERLGEAFVQFVGSNPPPVFQLTEQLAVRPGLLEFVAPEPTRTQSIIRVRAPLQLASSPPELPVWTHSDILHPTVVEVGVDPGGEVRSARLLPAPRLFGQAGAGNEGSGLPAADRAALAAARSLQFEPLASSGAAPEDDAILWGRVVFHWHAKPPPPAEPARRVEAAPPP